MCGLLSAIFIWKGGQRTKRTKEVQERLRLALAMDWAEDAGPTHESPHQIVVEALNDSGKRGIESNNNGLGAGPATVPSTATE